MTIVVTLRMNRSGGPVGSGADSESDPPRVPSVKGGLVYIMRDDLISCL